MLSTGPFANMYIERRRVFVRALAYVMFSFRVMIAMYSSGREMTSKWSIPDTLCVLLKRATWHRHEIREW